MSSFLEASQSRPGPQRLLNWRPVPKKTNDPKQPDLWHPSYRRSQLEVTPDATRRFGFRKKYIVCRDLSSPSAWSIFRVYGLGLNLMQTPRNKL